MTRLRASRMRVVQHPAQRRTLVVLSIGQALGGVGNGVAVGVGSLLVEQVTGDAAFAGLAATLLTLGGAVLAVPLARLAVRRGRRAALTSGALIGLAGTTTIVVGGSLGSWPVTLAGFLALGASMAVNLQSRFAATDLSVRTHRGRDLSLVVWMTTVGVVVGPQLIPPGDAIGVAVGLPHLVGAYVIVGVMQALTAVALAVGLRPDPLLTAQAMRAGDARAAATSGGAVSAGGRRPAVSARLLDHPRALLAIVVVASGHATMVGIMALTPVHLEHSGHSLAGVAITMSAHTAGMYALSPVFGILADRVGRLQTILLGQALLVGSIVVNVLLPTDLAPLSLALLGLGWSAATVAGSTLVSESAPESARPRIQGRSDLVQGLAGAAAGAVAGPILGVAGYSGLSLAMAAFVVAGCVAAIAASRTPRAEDAPPLAESAAAQAAPSGPLRDATTVDDARRRPLEDHT
ncbi:MULTISPECIES: MFS transporter [unclassified Agrococcus]|uniref:MFS transporter n=1 Tax=unclassified Agrococcus TaxID=2615065 RepID=UPI0036145E37